MEHIMKKRRDTTYIKIWESVFGSIPKDEKGRSYEIHHIDGNSSNNELSNLQCLSIEDHYNLHLNQGDFLAARLIAMRMEADPEVTRTLLSKAQQKRVIDGTHNWLTKNGGSETSSTRQLKKVETGTHHYVTKAFEESRLVGYNESLEKRKKNGTFHLLVDNPNIRRLKEGTHNLMGSHQNLKMLAEGKHSSQIKKKCPHCGTSMGIANYARYHGDKCKMKEANDRLD